MYNWTPIRDQEQILQNSQKDILSLSTIYLPWFFALITLTQSHPPNRFDMSTHGPLKFLYTYFRLLQKDFNSS